MRLNKYLAQSIGISRREADEYISLGRVQIISGEVARVAILGAQLLEDETVLVDGEKVVASGLVYLAMNKPVGYLSSRRSQGDVPTLYELLPERFRTLKTVGRLDRDSSGLILLTNDGDFAQRMTHPKYSKTKIYEVILDHDLAPLHQQMIADFGIELEDGRSQLGLEVGKNRKYWTVTMHEGRNRQIRRTFSALGYEVKELHRTQFGKYQLGGLKPGEVQEVPLVT